MTMKTSDPLSAIRHPRPEYPETGGHVFRNAHGARQMHHDRNAQEARKAEESGIMHRAHDATVRIIDKTERSEGGTGVLILASGKLLLATAAHVASPQHRLEIAPRRGETRHVLTGFVHDYQADVAACEITNASDLRKRAITLDDVQTHLPKDREHNVVIIGYPGEYMRPLSRGNQGEDLAPQQGGVSALTYRTYTIAIAEWPETWFGRKPDRRMDLFVSHDPGPIVGCLQKNASPWQPPADVGDPPPHLAGISGAGIWLPQSHLTNVWSPRPRLVGLQVATGRTSDPGNHLIRGVLITRWRKLVRQHFSLQKKSNRGFKGANDA